MRVRGMGGGGVEHDEPGAAGRPGPRGARRALAEGGRILDQVLISHSEYVRAAFEDQKAYEAVYGTDLTDELLLAWDLNREMTTRVAWKPYMYNRRLPPLLAHVQVPTLVVAAESDRIIPRSCAEQYVELMPQARLEIVRSAVTPWTWSSRRCWPGTWPRTCPASVAATKGRHVPQLLHRAADEHLPRGRGVGCGLHLGAVLEQVLRSRGREPSLSGAVGRVPAGGGGRLRRHHGQRASQRAVLHAARGSRCGPAFWRPSPSGPRSSSWATPSPPTTAHSSSRRRSR